MTPLRRIQVSRWALTALAVLFLSQCFSRWRLFSQAPTSRTYAGMLFALTFFLCLMAALAVAVYAEEKLLGHVSRARPLLDRWTRRLFLNPDEPEVR